MSTLFVERRHEQTVMLATFAAIRRQRELSAAAVDHTIFYLVRALWATGASLVFKVCHIVISLVYSLFQYNIRDGILLS